MQKNFEIPMEAATPKNDYAPMNAAEMMDRVFDLYKKTFGKQLAFSAIIGVISFVLIMLAVVVLTVILIASNIDNTDIAFAGVFFLVLAVVLPFYLIWTATADTGYLLLSKQAFYRERIVMPFKGLPAAALRAISAALMQLVLSLPWFALLLLVMYLAAGIPDINDVSEITHYFVTLSSGRWIFIGIIFSLLYLVYSNFFALAVPAAIFEKKLFFSAITRSWQLIRGEMWRILAIRLLWGIITYLFSYSAQGLWHLMMTFITTFSDHTFGAAQLYAFTAAGSLVQSLFTIVIGFIVGPLGGIFTALIYFNQCIKKEGLDIEIGLAQLSQSQGTTA